MFDVEVTPGMDDGSEIAFIELYDVPVPGEPAKLFTPLGLRLVAEVKDADPPLAITMPVAFPNMKDTNPWYPVGKNAGLMEVMIGGENKNTWLFYLIDKDMNVVSKVGEFARPPDRPKTGAGPDRTERFHRSCRVQFVKMPAETIPDGLPTAERWAAIQAKAHETYAQMLIASAELSRLNGEFVGLMALVGNNTARMTVPDRAGG